MLIAACVKTVDY